MPNRRWRLPASSQRCESAQRELVKLFTTQGDQNHRRLACERAPRCHALAAKLLPQPQAASLLGLSLTTKDARMSSSL